MKAKECVRNVISLLLFWKKKLLLNKGTTCTLVTTAVSLIYSRDKHFVLQDQLVDILMIYVYIYKTITN